MEKHIGITRQTLQNRVAQITGEKYLKLPSGNMFRVAQILGEDNNDYLLQDWTTELVSICHDHSLAGAIAPHKPKLEAIAKNWMLKDNQSIPAFTNA